MNMRLENIETKIEKILKEVEIINKQEKNAAFMRENKGKYCYPNLKLHLKGIQV